MPTRLSIYRVMSEAMQLGGKVKSRKERTQDVLEMFDTLESSQEGLHIQSAAD